MLSSYLTLRSDIRCQVIKETILYKPRFKVRLDVDLTDDKIVGKRNLALMLKKRTQSEQKLNGLAAENVDNFVEKG